MKRIATCAAFLALTGLAMAGVRPYEFDWANRTEDDRPVLMRLEKADGWRVENATDSEATISTGTDRILFGDGVMHVDYRATGKKPSFRMVPPEPVAIPDDADTVSIWIWGNSFKYAKAAPPVSIWANFVDGEDKPFSVKLHKMNHLEWFLVQRRIEKQLCERIAKGGAKFVGLTVADGTNTESKWFEFTSLAVYHEELKPLSFKPRAKRPNRVFPDAPAGVNTGDGELDFPDRALTAVPPTTGTFGKWRLPAKPWDWSDMAFCGPDGVWRLFARGGGVYFPPIDDGKHRALTLAAGGSFTVATNSIAPLDVTYRSTFADAQGQRLGEGSLRFHEEGLSLVLDLAVKGGKVCRVKFGRAPGIPDDAHVFSVPYYSYAMICPDNKRPRVAQFVLGGEPCYYSCAMDWTQSNASAPFCNSGDVSFDGAIEVNGGTSYNKKTDGERNDCYERLFWTFSPEFTDVLPSIPNPASPYRDLTAEYEWCHMSAGNREQDKAYWRDRKRRRLDKVFIGDHEVCMRDGNESFTFRTRPAPKKGGDEGMRDFTRFMIDEMGYLYGPYNNYTDFAPVNGHWHADHVGRFGDNSLQPAWNRCYAPKPVWAVEMCEVIVPELERKFAFNSGYCDVHTCVTPWDRCDYDARVPGAGTFAQTFYSYGELLQLQRKYWTGPVYSEGGCHFMYVGLNDGNFGQDTGARLFENPWLVDFDLLRMHPLANNFGMGYPRMFYGKGNEPKDRVLWIDRFLAATIAFGHVGYFMTGNPNDEEKGYWMIQPLAARYAKADVEKIRYADAQGRFVPTSEAIATGAHRRSQVATRYRDGTRTVVNGSADGNWLVLRQGDGRLALPANGWLALTGDKLVASISAAHAGGRADACLSPTAFYMDGRGRRFDSGHGATEGRLIRVFNDDGTEEIFIRHAQSVELPYAATAVVKLDAKGAECGAADFKVADGKTVLTVSKDAYSYKATKPSDWIEPPAVKLSAAFLMPADWQAPADVKRAEKPFSLPQAHSAGIWIDGSTEPVEVNADLGAIASMATSIVGGEGRLCFFMHPPFRGCVGNTYMCWKCRLPETPLTFTIDVGKVDYSSLGDGTLYRIEVKDAQGEVHPVASLQTNEHRWTPLTADLSPWKGQMIRLYLISDPGPKRNTIADHSSWSNPRFTEK